MSRTAVVLFNLGGPDSPRAIQPFLNNLFNDPAIIDVIWPLRPLLAAAVSRKREREAREIYDRIGGRSPIVEETEKQVARLESLLGDDDVKVFVSMRYWHPMSIDAAMEVKAFNPDQIVLLPLYPQFSSATTASSLRDWKKACRSIGVDAPTHTICCYPVFEKFIAAHANKLRDAMDLADGQPVRVLFSAHGLPVRTIRKGDPYQWQIEQTSAAIARAANLESDAWRISYQSRVGPLEWIGPSTEDAVTRAAHDGLGVVLCPVAFVCEHSETLVELDIQLAEHAAQVGCRPYVRVSALGDDEMFISALADLVRYAQQCKAGGTSSGTGDRFCPSNWRLCNFG